MSFPPVSNKALTTIQVVGTVIIILGVLATFAFVVMVAVFGG